MNNNNLVSVIVPVYKVENYLRDCLDSIVNQTYKNLEIILVDDGSPDQSGAICEEYARKDPLITVYHTENKGQAHARNFALDRCRGDYVTFIDSDDIAKNNYVERLYTLMNEYNADMSAFAAEKFSNLHEEGGGITRPKYFVCLLRKLYADSCINQRKHLTRGRTANYSSERSLKM